MKCKSVFVVLLCVISVASCASNKDSAGERQVVSESSKRLPSSFALPGTSTAVVGIGVDSKGVPLETVKEVVLKPGQKVVFAGPDRFEIKFKRDRAPTKQVFFESKSGVIAIVVPKNILENPEYAKEFREKKYVRFDYSIFVNGKELDPPLIIRSDD